MSMLDTGVMSEVEMDAIEVQGRKLRYLIKRAEGEALPLLICNGLGQSLEILLPLIEEFCDRTILAFDMPGVGKSEWNEGMEAIPDYADLALEFMDKVGVENFDLLGISWGGALAQQITRNAPDRVNKLVLAIASAGGIGSWWGTPLALTEIMFPMRFTNKAYGNFIGPWMYGGEVVLKPEQFKEYSAHALRPSAQGYFTQVRAMCNWTSLPWLSELTQPTLILAGQFDALIPLANQVLLAHKIKNARLKTFPDGHLLMFTRRREVAKLIQSFL
ncbi:alpha/beta fold hydrolase [Aliiroseovarius marinus]|uniref:alpha/beta fold hydrolase n=1 Tax=Aliiroseovarius marinus TaxID=2500159 RepID=UPI003D7EDAB5